eukprot:6198084-Pleurochrysis_carterae.AAC.4
MRFRVCAVDFGFREYGHGAVSGAAAECVLTCARRYNTLFFWDTLAKESDAAGVALNGRMLVADVSGASINKIRAALDIGKKMMATCAAAPRRQRH